MNRPRNRLTSIERIFVLAEILRTATSPQSVGQLNKLVGGRLGEHSKRTTLRDLDLLARLGNAKHDGEWKWIWADGAALVSTAKRARKLNPKPTSRRGHITAPRARSP